MPIKLSAYAFPIGFPLLEHSDDLFLGVLFAFARVPLMIFHHRQTLRATGLVFEGRLFEENRFRT
jgi:hypothetical protein